jgi:NAD(P)-dependent dehydrogenase (short-subunit alcohol dehydrogenase family)
VSDIDLRGRVCIVTGGSQGLGMAMAQGLAAAGAKVVIASPDEDNLKKVSTSIGVDRCLGIVADITSHADCQRVVESTIEKFGDLDVLVNNARYTFPRPNRSILKADVASWERAIHVNVFGTFLMTSTVLSHLVNRRWGRIINITTSLDTMQRRHYSPYGVAKAAIEAETMIWVQDLAGTGVMVNSLIPGGACETGRTRDHEPSRPGSVLLPIDIMVPPLLWLASDRSDGQTGGRYVGKLWNDALPVGEAAKKACEPPVFRSPDLVS